MKNTKHTQGPWIVGEYIKKLVNVNTNEETDITRYCVNTEDLKTHICDLKTSNKANAALIAAAPEMLEALEAALPHIKGNFAGMKAMELIAAAIQKAKGE